jgi:hypothetical protein
VDDGDAQPGGGRDVDGVEADPVAPDHLELFAGGHEALGAARLGPEQDALRLGRDLHQAGLGLVVAHDDAGTGLEVGVAVGVDGPGQDDVGTVSGHRKRSPFEGRENYR